MAEIVQADYQTKLSLTQGAEEYRKLRNVVTEKKILDRAYGYYAFAGAVILAGILATGYLISISKNYFLLAVFGLAFAFFVGQIGGFMHDAGHRAIFKTKTMNDIVGSICASVLFLNYRAWTTKHNFHHAHPNQEGKDPDIELPLFAFTHKRYNSKKGIQSMVQRYQAWLHLPMSCLLAYTMQFKGNIKYFINEFKKGFRPGLIPEIAVFLVFLFVWYVLPFLLFPAVKAIFLIICVPVGVGFYLANIFAPNHKGMPELAHDAQVSFLEQQIMTSRNVRSSLATDIIYFGLHYQIEHHLFPNCPRNKLKLITPYIHELCQKFGLTYTDAGVFESVKIILGELNKTAKAAANSH